jgi:hypothetical protein
VTKGERASGFKGAHGIRNPLDVHQVTTEVNTSILNPRSSFYVNRERSSSLGATGGKGVGHQPPEGGLGTLSNVHQVTTEVNTSILSPRSLSYVNWERSRDLGSTGGKGVGHHPPEGGHAALGTLSNVDQVTTEVNTSILSLRSSFYVIREQSCDQGGKGGRASDVSPQKGVIKGVFGLGPRIDLKVMF